MLCCDNARLGDNPAQCRLSSHLILSTVSIPFTCPCPFRLSLSLVPVACPFRLSLSPVPFRLPSLKAFPVSFLLKLSPSCPCLLLLLRPTAPEPQSRPWLALLLGLGTRVSFCSLFCFLFFTCPSSLPFQLSLAA